MDWPTAPIESSHLAEQHLSELPLEVALVLLVHRSHFLHLESIARVQPDHFELLQSGELLDEQSLYGRLGSACGFWEQDLDRAEVDGRQEEVEGRRWQGARR